MVFILFATLVIVLPIGTFFLAKWQLAQTGLEDKYVVAYSGVAAVAVLYSLLIVYCIIVVKDEANYRYERRDRILHKEKYE